MKLVAESIVNIYLYGTTYLKFMYTQWRNYLLEYEVVSPKQNKTKHRIKVPWNQHK